MRPAVRQFGCGPQARGSGADHADRRAVGQLREDGSQPGRPSKPVTRNKQNSSAPGTVGPPASLPTAYRSGGRGGATLSRRCTKRRVAVSKRVAASVTSADVRPEDLGVVHDRVVGPRDELMELNAFDETGPRTGPARDVEAGASRRWLAAITPAYPPPIDDAGVLSVITSLLRGRWTVRPLDTARARNGDAT